MMTFAIQDQAYKVTFLRIRLPQRGQTPAIKRLYIRGDFGNNRVRVLFSSPKLQEACGIDEGGGVTGRSWRRGLTVDTEYSVTVLCRAGGGGITSRDYMPGVIDYV